MLLVWLYSSVRVFAISIMSIEAIPTLQFLISQDQ
jgi:hypothetical protein